MMNAEYIYLVCGIAVAFGAYMAFRAITYFYSKRYSHVQISPKDYLEIHQLYSMYARDVDPGSVRNASWMFAKSATVIMEDIVIAPGNIFAFYEEVRSGQTAGVRHFNTSAVIIGTPDGGARGSGYLLEVQQTNENSRPEITRFGKYEDKFIRTREGWRFAERVFKLDTFRGDSRAVSASPVPGLERTYTTGIESA